MIVHDEFPQGSEAWFAMRLGKPTASEFSRVVGAPATRKGYIRELCNEALSPPVEGGGLHFVGKSWQGNWHADRGNHYEESGRLALATALGRDVHEVGFCVADDNSCGFSPDGLLRTGSSWETCDTGVEIKCPTLKNWERIAEGGGLPNAYRDQVHGSMVIAGVDSWHFIAIFPDELLPASKQTGVDLIYHHLQKRNAYTERLGKRLHSFVRELGARWEEMQTKGGLRKLATGIKVTHTSTVTIPDLEL